MCCRIRYPRLQTSRVPPRTEQFDEGNFLGDVREPCGANVKAVQRLLSHKSAAMTLDVDADLFDDDLEAASDALDQPRAASSVVVSLSRDTSATTTKPR